MRESVRPIRGHRWLRRLAALLLLLLLTTGLPISASSALNDDRYDGNIFALYAGNGSLVPPRSSLEQALENQRVAVLVYYLDDSASSKQFAPVVSELQRFWGNSVDLIPLVTDPLQGRQATGAADPAQYWHGQIPQVVVIDGEGTVRLDASGQVPLERINSAISAATGVSLAEGSGGGSTRSFNELNAEVIPSR